MRSMTMTELRQRWRRLAVSRVVVPLAAIGSLWGCHRPRPAPRTPLALHSAEFRREVVRAAPGVYVAVGYGLANTILLEGTDGVVIVDTMESAEAARDAKRALDRFTRKPLRAMIYTHNHADHVFGAAVFAAGARRGRLDVYAHASTLRQLDRIMTVVRPAIYRRSMRQFGTLLPEEDLLNAGIGPRLRFTAKSMPAHLRPNRTFSGARHEVRVAGLRLVLVHAPGETDDQIFVWLPERRVLLPGDNIYRSFPNLYAIRGTAHRDVRRWVESLDAMRALRPAVLVPSHGRPLRGEARIHETLTCYRDAIQFVHDQTVRGMNQGLAPDDLVQRVRLPSHLARHPYLQEHYGKVAWAVRAIYDGYLGWFDGNPTHLQPLSPAERARRMAALAGGRDGLLRRARQALEAGDPHWVLELTDHLIRLGPPDREARHLRAVALRALGLGEHNANARHYYLTSALEVEGEVRIGTVKARQVELVHAIPLRSIFAAMPTRLDPVRSARTDAVLGFRFPEAGEAFTVHVRRGVAEVRTGWPERADVRVTVRAELWKEIVAGMRSPLWPYLKGELRIEGGALRLARLLGLFDRE